MSEMSEQEVIRAIEKERDEAWEEDGWEKDAVHQQNKFQTNQVFMVHLNNIMNRD